MRRLSTNWERRLARRHLTPAKRERLNGLRVAIANLLKGYSWESDIPWLTEPLRDAMFDLKADLHGLLEPALDAYTTAPEGTEPTRVRYTPGPANLIYLREHAPRKAVRR